MKAALLLLMVLLLASCGATPLSTNLDDKGPALEDKAPLPITGACEWVRMPRGDLPSSITPYACVYQVERWRVIRCLVVVSAGPTAYPVAIACP